MAADVGDANRTVFVGNLDPLVKDEILYELFLQAGPVRRVTIARDREGRQRTFGFVLYKHAEAVPYAIALLNGICLYGRPLKLDFSHASTQDTGSFRSPGTEDKGPNAGKKGMCPQNSIGAFSGFTPQDQTPGRNLFCNWRPSPLPPLTPLAQHQVPPFSFASPFTSTPGPILPWPLAFWTPPFTPLLPTPFLPQEREMGGEHAATPKPEDKEREKEEKEKGREKSLVPAEGKTKDKAKPPQVSTKQREREKSKASVKEREQRERERPIAPVKGNVQTERERPKVPVKEREQRERERPKVPGKGKVQKERPKVPVKGKEQRGRERPNISAKGKERRERERPQVLSKKWRERVDNPPLHPRTSAEEKSRFSDKFSKEVKEQEVQWQRRKRRRARKRQ